MRLRVAVSAGWLSSTTWGLLILGPVLLLLGFAALAWPQRPREIVYVVDSTTAAQAGLPGPGVWRPMVTLPVQPNQQFLQGPAAPPPADLAWPPEEAPAETEPAREAPGDEIPYDPDLPMPTAGMHLHLTPRAK